jgi:hypothetical protein
MLISTALLLDSIIRNSVCTPAKLPCRRVEVGYENNNVAVEEIPKDDLVLTCSVAFLEVELTSGSLFIDSSLNQTQILFIIKRNKQLSG